MDENIDGKVLNAIDNFYKLKTEYENQNKELLKKLKSIYLSKQKSLKGFKKNMKNIKFKCINCKREVNTIFQIKNYEMKARCGDLENPCKLNIEINRGIFLPYNKIYEGDGIIEGLKPRLDTLKSKIIDVKTRLILKLITDVEAISFFDSYNEELSLMMEDLALREEIYLYVLNNESKSDNISSKIQLREQTIQEIKKDISELRTHEHYQMQQEEGSVAVQASLEDKDDKIITKVIDKYLTLLIPTIDEINSLKYRVNEMDSTTLSRHTLMYYDTQQIYYDPEDNAIISNEYGNPELQRRVNNNDDDDDDDNDYLL